MNINFPEYRELGSLTSYHVKPISNKEYYLLEIDRDGDAKVIDYSTIKERLEAKSERYNELAQKDKLFYWNIVRPIYDNWQKDIHKIYSSLKTLKDFNNAYIMFTNKHLELIDKEILPKVLKFLSLENGYFHMNAFDELRYEVKTLEKGFYDTKNNSRSQN